MTTDATAPPVAGRPLWQHLVIMCLAIIAPVLLLAGILAFWYVAAERGRVELAGLHTARSLASAIDRELAGLVATTKILALSPSLQRDDLAFFDRQAREVRDTLGVNVVMRDRENRQVINTRLPWGAPLPSNADIQSDRRVLATGQAEVSNIFIGAVAQRPLFIVNVPVFRGGEIVYFLNLSMPPERIRDVIVQHGVPEGWIAGVVDNNGVIVARSRDHETFAGKPAPYGLVDTARASGVWSGVSLQGVPIYYPYVRSDLTGWIVGAAIPTAILDAPLRRALWGMASVATFLIALSLLLAYWLGSRLAGPIVAIAGASGALARSEPIAPMTTPLREANEVSQSLAESSARLLMRERELRQFIDSAPVEIAMFDREMRYVAVSERYVEDYRLAGQQLIGRNHYEVFPDLPERWRAVHGRVLAGETLSAREDPFIRADGRIDWVRWEAKPWRRSNGDIGGLVLFVEFITARKQAEIALAESRRRLNAVLDNATVSIFLLNEKQQCVYMNAAAERLTGFNLTDLQGRALHDAIHHTKPDGSQYSLAECPIGRAFPERSRVQGEDLFVHKDGSFYPVAFTASPIRDEASKTVGTIIEVRDIAEAKAAEERQRLLINELNHRVKNTLAVVHSLAVQTAAGAHDLTQFKQDFVARLMALAGSHDLLTAESWTGSSLSEVARRALAPYLVAGDGQRERVTVEGPLVRLSPNAAVTLSLAFHELATNAAKYGALSNDAGLVHLTWRQGPDAPTSIQLDWVERGGPPVAKPARRGFGTRLIETALARELEGEATMTFGSEGFECRIRLDASEKVRLA